MLNFRQKVRVGVTMELPNVYAVFISCTDNGVVVAWIENYIRNRESVSDKRLKEVRSRLLRFVVPNLY